MRILSKTTLRAGLAAMALMVSAAQAHAATLVFTLTGPYNATWQMDSNPVPSTFSANTFRMSAVPGAFDGSFAEAPSLIASVIEFSNFNSSSGWGVVIIFPGNLVFNGQISGVGIQLFTGPTSAPAFVTGTYVLTTLTPPGNAANTTLTITPLNSGGVPEPATWAMMLAGFGLVGGALRNANGRRGRQVVKIRYAG
jgi:PEP-CTERM motif